ncbi:hypothetical protein [Streptomyces sp. NPDC003952]
MSDEFSGPSSAEGIQWGEYLGALLMFEVKGYEPAVNTVHGETSAVSANVIVLDGDKAETKIVDTLVFPKVLQSQIKGHIGGKVLGRLGQGEAKKGQSKPWKLSDATEADKATARAYIAKTVTTDAPF